MGESLSKAMRDTGQSWLHQSISGKPLTYAAAKQHCVLDVYLTFNVTLNALKETNRLKTCELVLKVKRSI